MRRDLFSAESTARCPGLVTSEPDLRQADVDRAVKRRIYDVGAVGLCVREKTRTKTGLQIVENNKEIRQRRPISRVTDERGGGAVEYG